MLRPRDILLPPRASRRARMPGLGGGEGDAVRRLEGNHRRRMRRPQCLTMGGE